ncbi:MAG: ABC transporter permease [bacterium]
MNFGRIKALVIRHLYLYKRSVPRLMDIFFWPVVDILTWGFLTVYLQKVSLNGLNLASILLGAIIFWLIIQMFQQAASVTFLEDVWEKNFLNIFVAPVKVSEFLTATAILALIRIILVMAVVSIVSISLYQYSIFSVGIYFVPFIAILMIFAFSIALFNMAVILRYGTSAQTLAFGLIFIFQPFSAVFYPVSALPAIVHPISYLLPSTYVFEGMRQLVNFGTVSINDIYYGLILSLCYVVLMIIFFARMFARVRVQGRLLKMDS